MRVIRCCLLSAFIGMSSSAEATSLKHTVRQPMNLTTSVVPASLNGQPHTEFAEVVTAIIEEDSSPWSRDWQPHLPLIWQTPVTPSHAQSREIRMGYLRMDIAGKTATLRHDVHQELGWQLALMTDNPTADVPGWIRLRADGCYGDADTNCTFDPLPSLDRKGIRHHLLCAAAPDYDGGTLSYLLQSDHHADVLMTISNDIVNNGVSHTLTFSRRRMDMPCGPSAEEGSELSLDDGDDTESSDRATKPYAAVAKRAFQNITPQRTPAAHRCQIDLYVDRDGSFATALAQREDDNAELCGRGIEALRAARYPTNPSGKIIHLKTMITRQ
ncbi:hypothetical protein [Zymobacter sp. IVIA_5232.4 C2]|uniref:hypothetical protein n=1 Tax=Zymobacter sp. IVIA_5232.4 C2 TaxID=3394855 RepID=UPI0039C132DA